MEQQQPVFTVVVLGGGTAGLTTAAAIAALPGIEVTLIERDTLSQQPSRRRGLPQAAHLHSLMVAGQHALDRILPGFTDDLLAAGAVTVGAPRDNLWLSAVGWCGRFPASHEVPGATRMLIDHVLHRRVRELSQVTVLDGTQVRSYAVTDGAVTGVWIASGDRQGPDEEDSAETLVPADLVIDATGRHGGAVARLAALGVEVTEPEIVDSQSAYASRLYAIPEDFAGDFKCISIGNCPPEVTRGGALLEVENRQWLVSLFDHLGSRPPTDEQGFLEFAASLRDPVLHETIRAAEPTGPIVGWSRMANERRDLTGVVPRGLAVVGDATCALNPVYAQGMSVAALGSEATAQALRGALADGLSPADTAAAIQRAVTESAAHPWSVAVGADLGLLTDPAAMDEQSRQIGAHMGKVLAVVMTDAEVNAIFFDVMMMVREPSALFSPEVMAKLG